MRTIKIIEHISLDGIVQAPGAPGEDGDYAYGGWSASYRHPAAAEAILEAQGSGFDLLLGRRTYDIWSGYWPKAPSSPFADSFREATKYVATHRPESLAWGPFEAVGPGFVDDIRRIKAQEGRNLLLWGSSTLTSPLLEHGLADEITLVVYPVLLGNGKRFFAEGTTPCKLTPIGTKTVPSGVVLQTYSLGGPLQFQT